MAWRDVSLWRGRDELGEDDRGMATERGVHCTVVYLLGEVPTREVSLRIFNCFTLRII